MSAPSDYLLYYDADEYTQADGITINPIINRGSFGANGDLVGNGNNSRIYWGPWAGKRGFLCINSSEGARFGDRRNILSSNGYTLIVMHRAQNAGFYGANDWRNQYYGFDRGSSVFDDDNPAFAIQSVQYPTIGTADIRYVVNESVVTYYTVPWWTSMVSAVRVMPDGTYHFYKNRSVAETGSAAYPSVPAGVTTFRLGCPYSMGRGGPYDYLAGGNYGRCKFWNRALSDEELEAVVTEMCDYYGIADRVFQDFSIAVSLSFPVTFAATLTEGSGVDFSFRERTAFGAAGSFPQLDIPLGYVYAARPPDETDDGGGGGGGDGGGGSTSRFPKTISVDRDAKTYVSNPVSCSITLSEDLCTSPDGIGLTATLECLEEAAEDAGWVYVAGDPTPGGDVGTSLFVSSGKTGSTPATVTLDFRVTKEFTKQFVGVAPVRFLLRKIYQAASGWISPHDSEEVVIFNIYLPAMPTPAVWVQWSDGEGTPSAVLGSPSEDWADMPTTLSAEIPATSDHVEGSLWFGVRAVDTVTDGTYQLSLWGNASDWPADRISGTPTLRYTPGDAVVGGPLASAPAVTTLSALDLTSVYTPVPGVDPADGAVERVDGFTVAWSGSSQGGSTASLTFTMDCSYSAEVKYGTLTVTIGPNQDRSMGKGSFCGLWDGAGAFYETMLASISAGLASSKIFIKMSSSTGRPFGYELRRQLLSGGPWGSAAGGGANSGERYEFAHTTDPAYRYAIWGGVKTPTMYRGGAKAGESATIDDLGFVRSGVYYSAGAAGGALPCLRTGFCDFVSLPWATCTMKVPAPGVSSTTASYRLSLSNAFGGAAVGAVSKAGGWAAGGSNFTKSYSYNGAIGIVPYFLSTGTYSFDWPNTVTFEGTITVYDLGNYPMLKGTRRLVAFVDAGQYVSPAPTGERAVYNAVPAEQSGEEALIDYPFPGPSLLIEFT